MDKLKGVQDLDGNTKLQQNQLKALTIILLDLFRRATVVDIDFYNDLQHLRVTVDDIQIDGNVISTITADTDLQLKCKWNWQSSFR